MDINDNTQILDIIESGGLYKIVFKDTQKELPFSVKKVDELTKDRWVLYTDDNRETILAKNGFFYGLYSCDEYEFIERISHSSALYLAKINGKYGVFKHENFEVCSYDDKNTPQIINWIINCVYDGIENIESNKFCSTYMSYEGKVDIADLLKPYILKIQHDDKKFITCPFAKALWFSKEYDEIYTPPQPMDYLVVMSDGKYGAIERKTGQEVIEPIYDEITDFPHELGITQRTHVHNMYEGYQLLSDDVLKRLDCRGANEYMYTAHCSGCSSFINIFGFFYNIFNCREYDFIEHLKDTDTYICKKDGMYGLINDRLEIVLDIVYPKIEAVGKSYAVISTYHQVFAYNPFTKTRSDYYDDLNCYFGVFVTTKNGLHGLMKIGGEVIVPPRCSKAWPKHTMLLVEDTAPYLIEDIGEMRVPIYPNGKYYGCVSLDFEYCYRIGSINRIRTYHLVKKNNKSGIIKGDYFKKEGDDIIVLPTEYISIQYCERMPNYHMTYHTAKEFIDICFIILQNEKGYCLYNLAKETIDTNYYDYLTFVDLYKPTAWGDYRPSNWGPFFIAKREDHYAALSKAGKPICDFIYDEINVCNRKGFIVRQRNNWGFIDIKGRLQIDCSYTSIKEIKKSSAIVIENETEKEVDFNFIDEIKEREDTSSYYNYRERQTYGRYSGSYAQDVMGYSDDDIDTIFDGDPDAYWNID